MGNPTITVKVAGRGTGLAGGGTSTAGHMWFELNPGIPGSTESFGFAPIVHGQFNDPGKIWFSDRDNYLGADYSITIELTATQYNDLRDFGLNPSSQGFDLNYNAAYNSCIDFTWKALDVANLLPTNLQGYEGGTWPTGNIAILKMLVNMSSVKWDALRATGYAQSFIENLLSFPAVPPPPTPPGNYADPLSLDLNGDGTINTLPLSAGVKFDLDNNGFAETTSWVAPADGLLVLDLNANNKIDGGHELFGTDTRLPSGNLADNGFEALAQYDINADGVINNQDSVFGNLRIWQDANSNGIVDGGELTDLASRNVTAIDTTYISNISTDANGVQHHEQGGFRYGTGVSGVTQTLWFEVDKQNTTPVEVLDGDGIFIDLEIHALPDAKGYGNVYT